MFDKFKRRSYELEYLDTGDYTPEEYEDCIAELQFINRWMGDAYSLKATLFPDIEANSLKSFSMLDVGAGSGELLRVAATWARETKRGFRGVGLELNERSAESIIEESSGFPEIGSVRGDALKLPFHDAEFDYVICSLFTHHFVEEQIIQILREMSRVAKRRIFVIDLHRDPIAYFLYTTLGKLILKNRLIRHDGALSILRSFKTEELLDLAQRAGLTDIWVERHFPSRLVLSASARKPDIKPRMNADEHKSDLRSSAFISGLNFDVIIAGAGPAGSSAAIHLARNGVRVLLVEQKKFPRAKLCGEFISPECRRHFENLGVAEAMTAAGPTALVETVFYSSRGHHVTIPSTWFGGPAALGLSRAVMDDVLLRRAQECGVSILEGATVNEPILKERDVLGVRLRIDGQEHEYRAPLTIDATGRARILSRKLHAGAPRSRPRLIAFKVHLRNTRVAPNACEIYFYPEGYGGLSTIEGEISNLCFIISAEQVRRHHSDPETVMRELVMKNSRAAYTLAHAERESEWLSASWERFGRQRPSPANGLLTIGDSAAFIDPFTGSGMLMAFESGELAADVILRHRDTQAVEAEYEAEYVRKFDSRLRISGLLRRAAFKPRLAGLGIAICSVSEQFRNRLARATRSPRTLAADERR